MPQKNLLKTDLRDLFGNKLTHSDMSVICRGISFILEAGIRLPEAFEIIAGHSSVRRVKKKLDEIRELLLKGESLHRAFESAGLPKLSSGMCRAGEETGRLPDVMASLADYYERENKNRRSLAGALAYPALIFLMSLSVMIFSIVSVIPNFVVMFDAEGVKLPAPTLILMRIGEFFEACGLIFFICLLMLCAAFAVFAQSPSGRYFIGFMKTKIPIAGKIYIQLANTRFCQCVGMTIKAGLPPSRSMDILIPAINNPYLEKFIAQIFNEMMKGQSLSNSLSKIEFIDPMIAGMTRIGERSGRLPEVFRHCAEYFESEADRGAVLLTKLAEPALTLLLGITTAFIMLSVIMPMFDMISAF